MKNYHLLLLTSFVLILFTACKDEDLAPIATFDAAEKGAYVRVVSQNNTNINLYDLGNSSITYTIEFVDLEKGSLVSEYNLNLVYQDNNPDNGDKSTGPIEFRSWSASEFETNKDGFKGLSNVTITANDLLTAVGLSESDLKSGDNFNFVGSVTTTSGAVYSATNSSAAVNGAAFRGFFNFGLMAFCPSNLEGDYTYQTVANSIICPLDSTKIVTEDLTGTVSFIPLGNGIYNMSDWSFGAYAVCYGEGQVADSGGLKFTDTCTEVSFSGVNDGLNEIWKFQSTIDGTEWVINWENTFGEKGMSTIFNPDGWDLTLE